MGAQHRHDHGCSNLEAPTCRRLKKKKEYIIVNNNRVSAFTLFQNRSVPGMNAPTAFNTAILSVENSQFNSANVVNHQVGLV